MSPLELKEAIKEAISEYHSSMQDEQRPFWVNREEHFLQHDSLGSLGVEVHEKHHEHTGGQIEFWGWVRETVIKTMVRIFVAGTLVLLTAGFVAWFKYHDEISTVFGG